MIQCCECGTEIKGNIKGDEKEWTISCWRCVDKKVQEVEQLQRLTGIEVCDMTSYQKAVFVAGHKERKGELVERLKMIRQNHRWPQSTMAAKLGVSRSYYGEMERGRKPLNDNALRLIDEEMPNESA